MRTCPKCSDPQEYWEIRCARCAISSDIPNDWPILLVGPSLRYRLALFIEGLAGAIVVGTVVYLLEGPAVQLLSWLFSGALLTIAGIVLLLIVVFALLACVSAAYMGYSQLRTDATYAVSKTNIKFSDVFRNYETVVDHIAGGSPTDTRFIDHELQLERIRLTRVEQGWLAQLLSYGNVEIYTDQSANPAMVIPGVINPHAFREKLELISGWRASASRQSKQGPSSKAQTP